MGAQLISNATVQAIEAKTVRYEVATAQGESEVHRVPADTVVIATGLDANPKAAEGLKTLSVRIREIGDIQGPGYLEGAIHDGFRAALLL